MAKVTVKYKEVVNPIESVTIVINQDELDTLMVVLRRIGGCPDNSPRKHINNILNALEDATVNIRGTSIQYELAELIDRSGKYSAIYFSDYPGESLLK